MKREKVFVFDFDGVIGDSFAYHLEALREYTGLSITREEYKEMSLGNFHKSAWYEENVDKMDGYGDYLAKQEKKVLIYEGIQKIIEKCATLGMCYIVSSGSEGHINDFLESYDLTDAFGLRVWGAQTHWSKVVKLERIRDERVGPEIVFVADTKGDIDEGNQANVETIAVTWGFHDRKTLLLGSPDKICESLEELERVLFA